MTQTYFVRYLLSKPAFLTVTSRGSRSDRGRSWLTNAFTHRGWISFLCLLFSAVSVKADVYTLPLSYNDAFLNNPYYVENAFLRTEGFAPNVKYWQPSQPNVEGIVTLKFDTPFNIQSASFLLGISAYTVGSDLNLDSNASAFLDVSTDNVNWTQVASQTNQNATHSGISGPWDEVDPETWTA